MVNFLFGLVHQGLAFMWSVFANFHGSNMFEHVSYFHISNVKE